VRATNQTGPDSPPATTDSRHRPGTREPNPAHPTGQERDYRAGQPLPRQWPTTANSSS